MAARKITDEEWADARKRYQREPATGYGQIAQALDCSKALVARHAQKNKWQKSLSAISPVSNDRVDSRIHNLQKPANRPERGGVHPISPEKEPPAPIPNNGATDIPVMPSGLTLEQQQDWIESAVLARQRKLNESQAREIRAAKATVYAAIKGAGKEGGFDAARTARQVVSALAETHKSEMANELECVRLSLNAFQGGRPRGCRITVHQRAGCQIGGGDNSPEAIERRAAVADARMTVTEARQIAAEADAAIARKGGWEIEDV
jgi:hypothetical protein